MPTAVFSQLLTIEFLALLLNHIAPQPTYSLESQAFLTVVGPEVVYRLADGRGLLSRGCS